MHTLPAGSLPFLALIILALPACGPLPADPSTEMPGAQVMQTATNLPDPATTTPAGPISEPSGLLVAFIGDDGNVFAYHPSQRAVPPITSAAVARDLRISPDGLFVAYTRDAGDQAVELWLAAADGSGERRLLAAADFSALGSLSPPSGLHMAWVPGTHRIVFSSIAGAAFEARSADDLHGIDADTGETSVLFAAGAGGRRFSISPDGLWLAFARPGSVNLARSDGSGLLTDLVPFRQLQGSGAPVDAPQLVWAPDSSSFLAITPPSEPFTVPALPALVYRVSLDGRAEELGPLPGADFQTSAPAFSPDLALVAYLRTAGANSDMQELVVQALGQEEVQVLTLAGTGLIHFDWAPAGRRLLFSAADPPGLYLAEVAEGGFSAVRIVDGEGFVMLRWVDRDRFLAWEQREGGWRLGLFSAEGLLVALVEGAEYPALFDSVAP